MLVHVFFAVWQNGEPSRLVRLPSSLPPAMATSTSSSTCWQSVRRIPIAQTRCRVRVYWLHVLHIKISQLRLHSLVQCFHNFIKNGETPIFFAAAIGRLDIIEYLVAKCNANPNRPNKVLTWACSAWGAGVCFCIAINRSMANHPERDDSRLLCRSKWPPRRHQVPGDEV